MIIPMYSGQHTRLHQPFPKLLECPERLDVISGILQDKVKFRPPVQAENVEYPHPLYPWELVHSAAYLMFLSELASMNPLRKAFAYGLDSRIQYYCRVTEHTINALVEQERMIREAVMQAMMNRQKRAMILARPPGHHAGYARGEGFCVGNNAAYAAGRAIKEYGARVAVIDFDRHHGNGTEEILGKLFVRESLFVSSYEEGRKDYVQGEKPTNSIRVPLRPHSSNEEVLISIARACIEIERFQPDLVVISAGFDMCTGDPLTTLRVTPAGYGEITRMICEAARGAPIISLLEGGYELSNLALCVEKHVAALSV